MEALSLTTCGYLSTLQLDSASLTTLDLCGCNSLTALALTCPALTALKAEFCSMLTDAAVAGLVKCPSLRSLNLSTCTSVSVSGIGALAGLSNLQHLDLSRTLLEGVLPMLPACINLTSLQLSNNQLLHPGELQALLIGLKSLRTTPSLRSLDVSYCNLPAELLAELAVHGGLETLVVSGGVTEALPPLLHGQDSAAHLRALLMMGCHKVSTFYLGVSPDGEQELATPLSSLTELRLNLARELRTAALALPHLTALQLENNVALTSVHLRCPELVSLSLQGCRSLGVEDVERIIVACPQLTQLNLQHCPGVGLPSKAALVSLKPGLTIKLQTPRKREY